MSDYRSNSIKAKDVEGLPVNPLLEGVPDKLKDTKEADKLERILAQIMYSDHKHREMRTFMKCKRCQEKVEKRRKMLEKYGFTDYQQYLTYKRVIELIKQKDER
jgi:hypothetical protein